MFEERQTLERVRGEGTTTREDRHPAGTRDEVRPLEDYHRNPKYAGDLDRADRAWAQHAANHGLTRDEIAGEILYGRDLGKKGSEREKRDYAERTASKAVEQAEREDLQPRSAKPARATEPDADRGRVASGLDEGRGPERR